MAHHCPSRVSCVIASIGRDARAVKIAPKKVEHHVAAVLAKLDVHTREAAATLARNQHLIDAK